MTARSTMLRARWLRSLGCCVAALVFAAFAHAAETGTSDRDAMIRTIADYWLASQQADGLLPYGFDFLTGKADDDVTSTGFIAREAGAIWVWARYYNAVRDERYVEPLRHGPQVLASQSVPFGKPRAGSWTGSESVAMRGRSSRCCSRKAATHRSSIRAAAGSIRPRPSTMSTTSSRIPLIVSGAVDMPSVVDAAF